MGWNRTEHEGRTCYERNGQRLFSTEEIDALDRFEKEQSEKRKSDFQKWREDDIFHEEQEQVESKPEDRLIAVILLVALMLLALYQSN